MSLGTRQTNLFAAEDWKKLYTTFSEADFQSYDFETIRKVMVDYLKTYYAEDFNDFTESSEYIALLDLIAFVAQSLAFRTDLNARENFLETAERRDSVLKLVKQLSYSPNRNRAAQGILKIQSVATSEQLVSSSGVALDRTTINWNDPGNADWQQQFNQIMNAAITGSQKVGKPYASQVIDGITVQQYNIAIPSSVVPVFAFSAPVMEAAAPFEAVSANILSDSSILEQDPGVKGRFGILYQQDGKGYASENTGFFLLFKQGQLQSLDFSLPDKLPNRSVQIPVDNINQDDVWLYDVANNVLGNLWTSVQNTTGSNAIYNSTAKGIRTIYSVNSLMNDQIELQFSDGTFGDIPQGNYRTYFRVSNGLTYRIAPTDMNGISITIPYISKDGRAENLTIIASLQYTVSNSSRRDLIDEIKAKAPQNFYTQNRMVNGEDYNIFPYTTYADILKVKSVNRFSTGISRGLDITDPTGKYSSTDIFSDDGAIYRNMYNSNFTFTFNTRNDVTSVIRNMVLPVISSQSFLHFYYDQYPVINLVNLQWKKVTDDTTTCTGFVTDNAGNSQLISQFSGSQTKYLQIGSLIKFSAPTGYYFDINNVLLPGTPQNDTDKTYVWASIQNFTGNGTNQIYYGGRALGAVTLTANIPNGALITEVYVPLSKEFGNNLLTTMNNLIFNNVEFGVRFDYNATGSINTDPWKIITAGNLNRTGDFSLSNTGSSTNTSSDSSWLIKFETDGTRYTVTYRVLDYVYVSQNKVRFINSTPVKTYDSKTNTYIKDNIKVLKINTKPGGNTSLDRDVTFQILDNVVESDGYVDTTKVLVTFTDSNGNGVIDDPAIFGQVSNSSTKNIFFQKYYDFDNLIRYALLDPGTVSNLYATKAEIELQKANYAAGKVFYATSEDIFYILTSTNNVKTLVQSSDYIGFLGRQNLYFQYNHNASETSRIDPAASNLIDTYILVRSYDDAYRAYISDTTGSLTEPTPPTGFVMQNDLYPALFEYKMLTDTLILNPGTYKPLFGTKANSALRAKFQVIKSANTTISDNELKSMVISAVNDYFAVANWDFGDTFYFSELSGYLHQVMGSYLSSVILVPYDSNAVFGSLYEIRCQPNEIFISAATVDDVEVVSGVLTGINSSGINTTNVVKGVSY
jgi:hypothetical protein